MKFTIVFLLALISTASVQNKLEGKHFSSPRHSSCTKTLDGGYMTYWYTILAFSKDNVEISDIVTHSKSDIAELKQAPKTYKLTMPNDKIVIIKDCIYFDRFRIEGNVLIGEKLVNNQVISSETFAEFVGQ